MTEEKTPDTASLNRIDPSTRGPDSPTPADNTESPGAEKNPEIADLQKELLYQRAEFENFRKRTEKRYREALQFATEPFAKDLLPVLDNLERALAHASDAREDALQALTDGLTHVLTQFRQVLRDHGVEDVPALGERFDPNVHESLAFMPGEADNLVAQVFENGYLIKGRLLRPAKVAVSKVATAQDDG
jgi:molecular chaperone GrpE